MKEMLAGFVGGVLAVVVLAGVFYFQWNPTIQKIQRWESQVDDLIDDLQRPSLRRIPIGSLPEEIGDLPSE